MTQQQVTQLIHNLGEATGLIDFDRVMDTAEMYEATCNLFGLETGSQGYIEVVALRNPTAFVSSFIQHHAGLLRQEGWLE